MYFIVFKSKGLWLAAAIPWCRALNRQLGTPRNPGPGRGGLESLAERLPSSTTRPQCRDPARILSHQELMLLLGYAGSVVVFVTVNLRRSRRTADVRPRRGKAKVILEEVGVERRGV
jgi:hypothetical protein